MYILIGFYNKSGQVYDEKRDKRSKYCKVLDTIKDSVEIISDIKLRKLCKENKSLHVLFYNTLQDEYKPSREEYNKFLSRAGKIGFYENFNSDFVLFFKSYFDNYFCFAYCYTINNYGLHLSGEKGTIIFSYNDMRVLSKYKDLCFIYKDETFVSRCLYPKIRGVLSSMKLSGKCIRMDYLKDSDIRTHAMGYRPYFSLAIFIFDNKHDLEVSYNHLCNCLRELKSLEVKKWYKFDVTKEDNVDVCYNSWENIGAVARFLLHYEDKKYIKNENDFYAIEVWNNAEEVYNGKFPTYHLSDIITGVFRC